MKLDLSQVWESQKSLDFIIQQKHNISINEEIINKQVIALIVEIAEFANEIKTFKYWKKDQTRNEAKVLEEYADVLHFFISLAIKNNIDPFFEIGTYEGDINNNLLKILKNVVKFEETKNANFLMAGFISFLEISQWLNYSIDTMIDSYYQKLKINFDRVASNY